MTLTEIVKAHPDLFYIPEPAWYWGHSFMGEETNPKFPADFELVEIEGFSRPTVRAVDLAALYVEAPHDSRWRKFIWTDDVDRWGERVYVAGCGAYGIDTFQIHRRIEPPCYWVRVP